MESKKKNDHLEINQVRNDLKFLEKYSFMFSYVVDITKLHSLIGRIFLKKFIKQENYFYEVVINRN